MLRRVALKCQTEMKENSQKQKKKVGDRGFCRVLELKIEMLQWRTKMPEQNAISKKRQIYKYIHE